MAATQLFIPLLISAWFQGCISVSFGNDCFFGNHRVVLDGNHGTACLAVYAQDPCKCSSFQLGGVNVWGTGQIAPTAHQVEEIAVGQDDHEIRTFLKCPELCQRPLGLSDGFIPDENIHILDSEVFDFGPEKARPVPPGMSDDGRPWCAGEQGVSGDVWIQVNLTDDTLVSGIRVEKVENWPAPSQVSVHYIDDANVLIHQEVIQAGEKLLFEHPIVTKVIRLYPLRDVESSDVCMRFELLGCQVHQDYLGMGNGSIPDAAINASSYRNEDTKPHFARARSPSVLYPQGSWCAETGDVRPWISVDLGEERVVTGVMTQGNACTNCIGSWVTHFKVMYTNEARTDLMSTEEMYTGNADSSTLVPNIFKQPVVARHVRIVPIEWYEGACLRFELLGCKDYNSTLGMDQALTDDEHITASSSKLTVRDPLADLRLGGPEHGLWQEAYYYFNMFQGVTIDLGMPTVVSGVTLYCGNCHVYYVHVEYTLDPSEWHYLQDQDENLVTMGFEPVSNAAIGVLFRQPVYARFLTFKLHVMPITGFGQRFPQIEFWGCKGRCVDKLGVEDGTIPDSALIASSLKWGLGGAHAARLNNQEAWNPMEDDTDPWLQVNTGSPTVISGVITQGGGWNRYTETHQWVKTFRVCYSREWKETTTGTTMLDVTNDKGTMQTFAANFDADTSVTTIFSEPILAMVVRIVPLSWNIVIAMRLELLGCTNHCQQKLGLESGRIPDRHITSSGSWNEETHGPQRARLNQKATPSLGLAGGWRAGGWPANTPYSSGGDHWLQVDFARWTKVTGIITQARQDKSQWVTNFNVMYLPNTKDNWKVVVTPGNGNVHSFSGNYDRQHSVRNSFLHQVVARSVRVHPTSWNGAPSMRLELLGCTVLCQSQLGMEDGTILDSAITASGMLSEVLPHQVRLNGMFVPMLQLSAIDNESWIQVNLNHSTQVSGVIVQIQSFYTSCGIRLKYAECNGEMNATTKWVTIKTINKTEVFPSLTNWLDGYHQDENIFVGVTSFFDRSVCARAIRLYPSPLDEADPTFACYVLPFDFIGCLRDPKKARTCQSLKADGYLLDDVYELDIDGFDQGEPPFKAFCSMSTGETIIDHDMVTTGGEYTRNGLTTMPQDIPPTVA